MKNYLRISLHPSKPLIWWFKNRDVIDFDPPYQRKGRLWSLSDKAYLIDSIINGFDVPKLYVADFTMGSSKLSDGGKEYAIIDGKQRFEAVFDFFDNKLALNEDFVWRKDPSLKLGGLALKDLRNNYPRVADAFETETFDVMSVVTDDVEDVQELFVRLNRSKPLTGAEIRKAMAGQVSEAIRNVAIHEFFTSYIRFSAKRAGDFNAAAKIMLFEYRGQPVSTKKTDLDAFAKMKDPDQDLLELCAHHCVANLDRMTEVFLPRDELLSSAGAFPVYYWLVKSSPLKLHVFIREFLLSFEERRRTVKVSDEQDSPVASDIALTRYNTYNRSTDDRRSHLERLKILEQFFVEWLRTNVASVEHLDRRIREMRAAIQSASERSAE